MAGTAFPNESRGYRRARDELLSEELDPTSEGRGEARYPHFEL